MATAALRKWVPRVIVGSAAAAIVGGAVVAGYVAYRVHKAKPPKLRDGTAPWSLPGQAMGQRFRMKESLTFVAVVWGTRGDVQPVLLLSQELIRRGHRVRLSVQREHMGLVKSFGLEGCAVELNMGPDALSPADMAKMMAPTFVRGADGKAKVALVKTEGALGIFGNVFSQGTPALFERFHGLSDGADCLIGQMAPFVTQVPLLVAQARQLPVVFTAHDPMTLPSPRAPFKGLAPGESSIAQMLFVSTMFGKMGAQAVGKVYDALSIDRPTGLLAYQALPMPLLWSLPMLVTYPASISPLHECPPWWHQDGPWVPAVDDAAVPAELVDFVAAAPSPPVYIGFGSFDAAFIPDELRASFTRDLYSALKESGHTSLVAHKGQIDPDVPVPAGVHVHVADGFVPHHWLFPRCGAIVLHGGAGTAMAGLRSGKPVVVVPVTPLQKPWGLMVENASVGTMLDPKQLHTREAWVKALSRTRDPAVVAAARDMGSKVQAECDGGVSRLVDSLLANLQALHERNVADAGAGAGDA